jgi:hypothetical protein
VFFVECVLQYSLPQSFLHLVPAFVLPLHRRFLVVSVGGAIDSNGGSDITIETKIFFY